MKHLLPWTVLVWLALAGVSRADMVNWTYSTTPNSPNPVVANSPSPLSSIMLGSESNVSAAGSTGLVLASLTASSSQNPSTPDTFTSQPWSTNLTITDTPSGLSKTVTISGTFSGTMSSSSSLITSTFTGPASFMFTLGSDTYVVTPDAFLPPNVPNASNTGGIGANVSVATPEPSSLLLGCVGFACAFASCRKRSRVRIPCSPAC